DFFSSEVRNVSENFSYSFTAPNDYQYSSWTGSTSWADSVRQGTESFCKYYYTNDIRSECWEDDWRPPATETYITNNVQAWTTPIGGPGAWRTGYINVTGNGPPTNECEGNWGLATWTHTYSDERWVTPMNNDGITYVYAITPLIYPAVGGVPISTCAEYGAAKTNFSTITVGGYAVNTNGVAYLALRDATPFNITPRDSSLSWYEFADMIYCFSKYHAPSAPSIYFTGVISPDYNFFSRTKTTPPGVGYDPYILENIITNLVGTSTNGIAVTNAAGTIISVLSEAYFQVPNVPDFNTGWNWRQDVSSEVDIFDPL